MTVLIVIMNRQITKANQRKYFNLGVILCFITTIGILISILVNYIHLFNKLHIDSVEVIAFANKENCSDGVLAEALRYYEKRSHFDQILIRVGYISTTFVMLLNLIFFLFFSEIASLICSKSYLCIKLRHWWSTVHIKSKEITVD